MMTLTCMQPGEEAQGPYDDSDMYVTWRRIILLIGKHDNHTTILNVQLNDEDNYTCVNLHTV